MATENSDHARHPSQWRPAGKRLYSREQDTREKLVLRQVRAIPGQINYYMVCCSGLQYEISEADAETRVRNAWVSLRCSHPSIAVRFDGTGVTFSPLDPDRVDSWVAETFFIHRTDETAVSMSAALRPAPGMQLHFLPRTKEMILAASHEHADGHGMIMLLDAVCHNMAFPSEPCFENQEERLSPPLDVAAGIEAASDEIWKKTEGTLKDWKQHGSNPISIPHDLPGPSVGEIGTTRLVLSDKDSSGIFAFARSHKVSVNDLMNGAVIMAAKQHGGCQQGNWIGGVLLDARTLCKHPFNTAQHAATIYFATYPAWVETPDSVLGATYQIQQQRLAFQKDPNALQTIEVISRLSAGGASRPLSAAPETRAQVEYSGLGRLDGMLRQFQGDIEILDFWMSVGHLTAAIGVYCHTYRGRLGFTISYNPGFHSSVGIFSFKKALNSILGDIIN